MTSLVDAWGPTEAKVQAQAMAPVRQEPPPQAAQMPQMAPMAQMPQMMPVQDFTPLLQQMQPQISQMPEPAPMLDEQALLQQIHGMFQASEQYMLHQFSQMEQAYHHQTQQLIDSLRNQAATPAQAPASTSTETEEKTKFPIWAKVLLGLASAGIVLIIGLWAWEAYQKRGNTRRPPLRQGAAPAPAPTPAPAPPTAEAFNEEIQQFLRGSGENILKPPAGPV